MFLRCEARLQRRIVASYQPRASNLVNRQMSPSKRYQLIPFISSFVTLDQFWPLEGLITDPKGRNQLAQLGVDDRRFIRHTSQLSS